MANAIIEVPRKKKSFNRRKNFVVLPYFASITLGTLADNTVVTDSILDAVLTEDIFIISMDCLWTLRGLTAGEVPIFVGMAHGSLTVAQILEAIDASPLGPDSIIAREQARRPVRKIGYFSDFEATDQGMTETGMIRKKIKFSVGDGIAINGYAVNRSGGALTTGATVLMNGNIYGRWQR